MIDGHRLNDLLYFIEQRELARIHKEAGDPAPWCHDKIIQNYRFCNVDRQDDRVTKAIQTFYFYHPDRTLDTLWFNLAIARVFNNPDCLYQIGYITEWDMDHFISVLDERQAKGLKLFNAAYMIHARTQGIPKHHYLAKDVFNVMWSRKAWAPLKTEYLAIWASFYATFYGMGAFMRNQIVTDIRYSPYPGAGKKFLDWDEYVEAGPGSIKGLNYLHNRKQGTPLSDVDAYNEIRELQSLLLNIPEMPGCFLDPNNVSNVMCEYSKFMRTKLGEGKPKQKYHQGA